MGSGGMGRGGRGGIIISITFTFHPTHVLSFRYSLHLRVPRRAFPISETVFHTCRPRSFRVLPAVPHVASMPSEDATTTTAVIVSLVVVPAAFAAATSPMRNFRVSAFISTVRAASVTLTWRLLDTAGRRTTAASTHTPSYYSRFARVFRLLTLCMCTPYTPGCRRRAVLTARSHSCLPCRSHRRTYSLAIPYHYVCSLVCMMLRPFPRSAVFVLIHLPHPCAILST